MLCRYNVQQGWLNFKPLMSRKAPHVNTRGLYYEIMYKILELFRVFASDKTDNQFCCEHCGQGLPFPTAVEARNRRVRVTMTT
jgi:hypothetical protein